MIKGNFRKSSIFAVTLSLTLCSTVFAAPAASSSTNNVTAAKNAQQNITAEKNHGGWKNPALFQKLGLSEQDLIDAQKSGKTLFDLAKNKGYTPDQVRNMIIQDNTAAINKAVSEGRLTRAEADTKIKQMTTNIQKWDGKIKAFGRHGKMFGIAKKLGISKEEIASARQSGKTFFDIAKTKGYTEDQVKNMMIKDKTDAINKAVTDGKLTRSDADTKIKAMTAKIKNWDGSLSYKKN